MDNQSLGNWGEELAARWLVELGARVAAKNLRTQYGEIDIVAMWEDVLMCVEVKTRRGNRFGEPIEAITPRKLSHMRLAAEVYAMESRWQGAIRLVVVTVDGRGRCELVDQIEVA